MTDNNRINMVLEGIYKSLSGKIDEVKTAVSREAQFSSAQQSASYENIEALLNKKIEGLNREFQYLSQQSGAVYENNHNDIANAQAGLFDFVGRKIDELGARLEQSFAVRLSNAEQNLTVRLAGVEERLAGVETAIADLREELLDALNASTLALEDKLDTPAEEPVEETAEPAADVIDYDVLAEKIASILPETDYDVIADKVVAALPATDTDAIAEKVIAALPETDTDAIAEKVVEGIAPIDYDLLAERVVDALFTDEEPEAEGEPAEEAVEEVAVEPVAETVEETEEAPVCPMAVEVDTDAIATRVVELLEEKRKAAEDAEAAARAEEEEENAVAEAAASPEPVEEVPEEEESCCDKMAARLAEVIDEKLSCIECKGVEVDHELIARRVVDLLREEGLLVATSEEPVDEPAPIEDEPAPVEDEPAPVEDEPAPVEETVEEAAPVEETVEEPAEEVAPVEESAPVDELAVAAEPAPVEEPVSEDNLTTRYKRSFIAKIIESDDDVKDFYSTLKNSLLCYPKMTSQVNWSNDRFAFNNDTVAKVGVRGRTLCVYLALNPEEFPESVYHQKFAGDTKMYEKTPLMMKVKSRVALKRSLRLIELLAERLGAVKDPDFVPVDYTPEFAFRSEEELLREGLIKMGLMEKSDLNF